MWAEAGDITSSFGGEIDEISDIYVDNFGEKDQKAYFLSHAHSDHTVGLFGRSNAEQLRQNAAKIYMSEKTQTILSINHWHYNETKLHEIVEPLKVGMTYTIDLPGGQSFQVTMIQATHMIGAVMFLFKTKEKTVLYTGDFVIEEDDINGLSELHDRRGNPLPIDTMYVDATFDNEDYQHFPSRSLCHREVVNEVKRWLFGEVDTSNRGVALFQKYQFGYDDIYKAIYRELEIKLFAKLHTTYRALYGDSTVLTDNSDSKIHVCENDTPGKSHDGCGVSTGSGTKYLHIYMSAQRGCCYDPNRDSAIYKESDNSLYLCYPTHCSKSQLDAFINHFRPKRTVKLPRSPVSTPSSDTPFKRERAKRKRENADGDGEGVKRRLNF